MSIDEQVKVCVDRILLADMLVNAADRAMAENPTNRPAVSFSPGLGIAPLSRFDLAALTAKKWDNGRVLRVRFLDGDPEVQARLQRFAHQWSAHANISFVFDNSPNAEIRVSFQDKGSWSYIGTDALSIPTDEPTMNFGWLTRNTSDDEYSRVVIHEFGHALGCIHEHQNPVANIPWDKDAVYAFYAGPPNNWSKEQVDRNLFQKYAQTITQFSQFDSQSIMLYAVPNEFTIGNFEVGFNRILSNTDKSFVSTLYPKITKPGVSLTVNARSKSASIGNHGEEDIYQFVADRQGCYQIETSGATDVEMILSGPDDETKQIAHDDDSGFLYNARIIADLMSGTYYVRIRHYRPQGTGNYRIRVKRIN